MNFKYLLKALRLNFDRSFSRSSLKQLIWLCGIIFTTLLLLYISSFYYLSEGERKDGLSRSAQILWHFLDPSSLNDTIIKHKSFVLFSSIMGMVLFGGLLISVISNLIQRRVELYQDGDIEYPFKNHVVVVGSGSSAISIVKQACLMYKQSDILIQTSRNIAEVRKVFYSNLTSKEEKRLTFIRGSRSVTEELLRLRLHKAKHVFVLGEHDEYDHDSLSLDCVTKIAEILENNKVGNPLRCDVLFEYQSSFATFQLVDIPKSLKKHIQFCPFNHYEAWAYKLLVEGRHKDIKYPPLDRINITEDSEQTVHLVIVGMGRMGIALAIETAHIAHYPNYSEYDKKKKKTHITFIDDDAEVEMNLLKGRYRNLFQVVESEYFEVKENKACNRKIFKPNKDQDFIDLKFTFIKSRAESPYIHNYYEEISKDKTQLLSIAICFNFPSHSIAMGLYLPDVIYNEEVPVYIRQRTSSSLIDLLRTSDVKKYRNVYPFGMIDDCLCFTLAGELGAKLVNYTYIYLNDSSGEVPVTKPFAHQIDAAWEELKVVEKWSNCYCYNSFYTKLRSIGFSSTELRELTDAEVETLARVEHNRWNVEKLLIGFRPPNKEEKNINRFVLKEKYIHPDIIPFDKLSLQSQSYDKAICKAVPFILQSVQSDKEIGLLCFGEGSPLERYNNE